MKLIDRPEAIIEFLSFDYPEVTFVLDEAGKSTQKFKGSIQPYQAAILYWLVSKHVSSYGKILEVGTGLGYTSWVMSAATPTANITTLNPSLNERLIAKEVLNGFHVDVLAHTSREFFELDETKYDLIFIDGDHNDIAFDCKWYDRLAPDGLIIFHDYSPIDAWSPQPIVFNYLNKMKDTKWGPENYLFVDNGKVGMIAWQQTITTKDNKEKTISNTIPNPK